MKKLFLAVLILAIVGIGWRVYETNHRPEQKKSNTTQNSPADQGINNSHVQFDKNKYSLTDPNSVWVVVNKQRQLNPKSYAPADLVFPKVPLRVPGNESMQMRKEAGLALETMFSAAKKDNLNLMLGSGYRSYSYQVNLYGGYVNSMGQAQADKTSARPGYSEHQTGLAVDVEPTDHRCRLEKCFAGTPEGQWLVEHAREYGFILRYLEDKVAVTGYEYEPWHYRFVGKELAGEMKKQNITTLEEFFSLPAAPGY